MPVVVLLAPGPALGLADADLTSRVRDAVREATGLELSETADKRMRWLDAKGTAKASAPAPVMWDSSFDRASGDAEHMAPVDVEIEAAEDGGDILRAEPQSAEQSAEGPADGEQRP